jgi:L-glyceraldehyde reductase
MCLCMPCSLTFTTIQAVNQIEAHPLLPQDDLAAYCKKQGIHITAYSPLGNNRKLSKVRLFTRSPLLPNSVVGTPLLTEHPKIVQIAAKLNVMPAQVLIAWGVYRGYSVIPKSVQENRIESNFKQVELGKSDYEQVAESGLGNHTRHVFFSFMLWM